MRAVERGALRHRGQPVRVLHAGHRDAPGLSRERRGPLDENQVRTALAAHLCRCTGWQSIVDAAALGRGTGRSHAAQDPLLAAWRAEIEGGPTLRSPRDPRWSSAAVGSRTTGAPGGALVALAEEEGSYVVAESLREARARRGRRRCKGRNTDGPRLVTHWKSPRASVGAHPAHDLGRARLYLEPDASWCPSLDRHLGRRPLANGGAFGGKPPTHPFPSGGGPGPGRRSTVGRCGSCGHARRSCAEGPSARRSCHAGCARDGTGGASLPSTRCPPSDNRRGRTNCGSRWRSLAARFAAVLPSRAWRDLAGLGHAARCRVGGKRSSLVAVSWRHDRRAGARVTRSR